VRSRRFVLSFKDASRADYDFEGQIDFVTVPEFFHSEDAFVAGLGTLFGSELIEERAKRRGDFGETVPSILRRSRTSGRG